MSEKGQIRWRHVFRGKVRDGQEKVQDRDRTCYGRSVTNMGCPRRGLARRGREREFRCRITATSLITSQGTLDIMIMRSGKQDGQKVTFIKNNIFHDAFFLKALVLNGACSAECEPTDGGKRYSVGHLCYLSDGHSADVRPQPYGAALPGSTFKFSTMTANGRRVPSQGKTADQIARLLIAVHIDRPVPYQSPNYRRLHISRCKRHTAISDWEESTITLRCVGMTPVLHAR
jgi:hypothetical protein